MKISFIGYGNMAKAIAKSLANNPLYQMHAASPSLTQGVDEFGVQTHNANDVVVQNADLIILAVKPNKMGEALAGIEGSVTKNCVIISVATGVKLSSLAHYFQGKQPIVRCMPNIALSVNKGASPLCANQFVSNQQKQLVAEIFEKTGIITWLKDETEIDAFTALSGSGPAYVFLFLEALEKAGVSMGLDKDIVKQFSLQTLIGAVELSKVSGLDYKDLRRQVTSPNGTTAAAVSVFEAKGFEEAVIAGVKAAWVRALELGKD